MFCVSVFFLLSTDPISSKVSEWSAKKQGKKKKKTTTKQNCERRRKRHQEEGAEEREPQEISSRCYTNCSRIGGKSITFRVCNVRSWNFTPSLGRQIHSQFWELQNSKETSTFLLLSSLKFLEFLVWPVHPENYTRQRPWAVSRQHTMFTFIGFQWTSNTQHISWEKLKNGRMK